MSQETYDEPGCTLLAWREKAIKVERANGETVWIPRSVVDDDSEVYAPDIGPDTIEEPFISDEPGTLVVALWWAEKQGWL